MTHRLSYASRREFLRAAGVAPVALPFLQGLPALAGVEPAPPRQRLIVVFSPNGTIPKHFWPEPGPLAEADALPEILQPLAPFRDRTLLLKGLNNQIRGDGDGHMRGIGCLLTGIELLPGNVQGGSDTPAGWSSGMSIDQHLRGFLQARPDCQTRFGSLEFGVVVPNRANTWTRMVYAGANKPLAPIDDPYQMLAKLYGDTRDRESLRSVLGSVQEEFRRVSDLVGEHDRRVLQENAQFVHDMHLRLEAEQDTAELDHPVPDLEPGVGESDENMPKISRMQIELMVNALACDFTRVATLQYTQSVGGARMRWLDVQEGHHELSHKPDADAEAVAKLTRINRWYAGEIAHLAKRLDETPEPGGDGTLLDNTLIVWTNELGKGNNHTRDDIPFLLVGGRNPRTWNVSGGRAIDFGGVPHNRLLMWLAGAYGDDLQSFGNPDFCGDGALTGLG
ncbi:DUF1552 domain-containing protein [Botrimarina sp.]|uniref:DUF1552 domain-containing protein n=1 Tax=Botrimarina sp. TaxID=2795802 RepID=UPI0032EE660D